MPFYMSTKGILHAYEFEYLKGEFANIRLEPTLILGIDHKNHARTKSNEEHLEKELFAIDIMQKSVKSLTVTTHLDKVRELMQLQSIRHIPIIENKKFVGMISDRDLLKVDLSGTFAFMEAKDIMTSIVIVTTDETPLAHIARVLLEEKISSLPVVDKSHHLVGIITRSDILRAVIYNRLVMK